MLCCTVLLGTGFSKAQHKPLTKDSFSIIDLQYPGLEKVKQLVEAGKYNEASAELLNYYRNRKTVKHPEFNVGDEARFRGKDIGKANREKADNALEHKFQPQKGYGFYDYGKDINWQYWPVKDNEVRWQLHRVYWWTSMGLAYRSSADEKYAKEWVFQFRDWATKNPLGLSKDNDRFAWRPLEVSERINSLPGIFNLFVPSPEFTPDFLMEFLSSFNHQTEYVCQNYSEKGNHLLFEAQRVLGAGCIFPELKLAPKWRKSGIDILNEEIKKQVYDDGLQWELSPVYHNASIDIFLKAYRYAQLAKQEHEFPSSYKQTVEKMILATINFSFPDYSFPMFGDSWVGAKANMIKQYQSWSKAFPNNQVIKYFATDGKEGTQPEYLSNALKTAGFYTFRNGWTDHSTVMTLKASRPGMFHAQPDNGTFELWIKGRNFTPDAGCYVYSGDEEIMKMRNWYRQTKVHSTLTLNDENMVITDAKLNKWKTDKKLDILTYTNPSYSGLQHQRSVLFVNQKYFIIIDKANGEATGDLATHFQLKEDSKPVFDKIKNSVYTTYSDNNNLLIQNFNTDKISLKEEEGKVSYAYQKEEKRPAFAFEKSKTKANNQYFITLLYPFETDQAPQVSIIENKGNNYEKGIIDLTIVVNGKKEKLTTLLY